MKIGWVGLGEIGSRMVKRLLGAGHDVTVYARGAALEEIKAAGAKTANDYATLAASSDLFIVCVYTDEQVADILFSQGALAAMRPGSIASIHTTGSPTLAREAGQRAPQGVSVLDATFSAGPDDVAAGKAVMMVGGDAAALEKARPAFSAYAGEIHHVGPLGAGQTIKLLNNLVFASNLMNTVELLHLAERQGLDTRTVAKTLQGCSGFSYAMRMFQAGPVDDMMKRARPYLEKDVATAAQVAREGGLDISAFAATEKYFQPK
jgi:3-hydroxyisobutyrate dehydrogenase-like beta-hydroxyacid dehydrogenase